MLSVFRLVALSCFVLLALGATPAALLAQEQEPPDEKSGGVARTEEELGALGRLAEMPELTAQRKARGAYNLGLKHSRKASRLEEEAAASAGGRAAEKAAKARKSYEKAIEQFRNAVEHVPGFAEAHGSLGYALLKTGQYPEALTAYNRALTIGPRYPEAIAERGEVYLGLNMIERAQGAYLLLERFDRVRAAKLMTAMKRWLDRRRNDPGAISEDVIEGFAAWIEERDETPAPS